ncbi:hypothetical protein L1987_74903 [Smallanthus sonchifolius]|uniref:Uncharacterized protein n=1 Tax=Smallanthus sonchifolius TaxID=185202 RepID=A0ACB9A3V3_9ASTR|nr:hypothetical protein L1987_74903 [Smallanthus sonchifolius]
MFAVLKVKEKILSSNSPCAACKFLRRKCTQECVFAPYFPPDQPQKFANVHKVYGASNVAKLLNDLPATQREDAVNSLAYEADARLRDPVYGCVGLISILQRRLKQVQTDLENAKRELATYIGPSVPILNQGLIQQAVIPYNMQPDPVLGLTGPRAFREVQQPQANGSEFSHMTTATAATMSPCLSLGGSYDNNTNNNNTYQIQYQPHHLQHHHQLLLQQQQLPPQRAE